MHTSPVVGLDVLVPTSLPIGRAGLPDIEFRQAAITKILVPIPLLDACFAEILMDLSSVQDCHSMRGFMAHVCSPGAINGLGTMGTANHIHELVIVIVITQQWERNVCQMLSNHIHMKAPRVRRRARTPIKGGRGHLVSDHGFHGIVAKPEVDTSMKLPWALRIKGRAYRALEAMRKD